MSIKLGQSYRKHDLLLFSSPFLDHKVTQDELRQTLITIGAKTTATKASMTLNLEDYERQADELADDNVL
jgi:hypothetical protein